MPGARPLREGRGRVVQAQTPGADVGQGSGNIDVQHPKESGDPGFFYVGLIVGGHDKEGGHVYSLDAAGGSIPDNYISVGSGSPYAYGVLEDHFRKRCP